MRDVLIALAPAGIVSICLHGINALIVTITAVLAAVLFEGLFQKLAKKPVLIYDLSAAVTGILVAYGLPTTAPWWLAVIGSGLAILLVKQLFGGIGRNFVNPALAARAILLASWPVLMTAFSMPDVISAATPLAQPESGSLAVAGYSYSDLFFGFIPGSIGEISKIALLIGAAYLVYRRIISLRIPLAYIATVAVMVAVFNSNKAVDFDVLYHLLSGGLILVAFFMATDYTTSPMTPVGQIVFGIGCGVITSVIRLFGAYPEGVTYSVLLMNLFVPLIDRFIHPKLYGEVRRNARNG